MEDNLSFIDGEFLEKNGFQEVKDKSGVRYTKGGISVLFEFPDEKVSVRVDGIPDELIDISEESLRLLLGVNGTVDLIASGYEWTCPDCDCLNEEMEVPSSGIVTCSNCGKNYGVSGYCHANE